MDFYSAIFASATLAFAFACILWGLRIFKIFLVILGLWVGFVVGLFMGEVFVGPSGSLIFYGIAGAVIFALLAWPLQKLFVFSGVGLLVGFFVFAMVMSRGGEPESGLIAGATMFIVAGFIAVLVYDYFVIVMMALVSAYAIINISYLPNELRELLGILAKRSEGLIQTVERFGGYYAELIWPSIVVLGMVILFSIYMQKIIPEKQKKLDPERIIKRGLVWHTTFFLAAVIVVYAFLSRLFGLGGHLYTALEWSAYQGGLMLLTPGESVAHFCHCPILNLSPISFPLAAYISYRFIRFYRSRVYVRLFNRNKWLNGWLVGLVLGIIILPLVEMFTLFAMFKFENFDLAGQYWLGYYKSFVAAPWKVVVFKWLYSWVIFPLAFILIVPRPDEEAPREEEEPSVVNYCI
ncbi:MAG TPA: hypothetical protein ENO22_13005 [candidate division Zixibacteria bacterium]|nr:hypothetical protein [candidate division Zixibacteria bacterium]